MTKKNLPEVTVTLDKIVGGGQALGTLPDGEKLFAWGGLPAETVTVQLTKKKSHYCEGVVTEVLSASPKRVVPKDADSYLSTSPWQIMTFSEEQHLKAALIDEAFELHGISLPGETPVYTNNQEYGYRNKVEYSFWYDTDTSKLSLAFFRRGTHGKIPVLGTSLARPEINQKAPQLVDILNQLNIEGRALKTLLIRCSASGAVSWQLYVKTEDFPASELLALLPDNENGEVIYSNPKSPASVITRRLAGKITPLSDTILDTPFSYATEGFFQVNLPVYEQALRDMREWVTPGTPVVDLYSGVGTIGLTIGGNNVTMVEINEAAVQEMQRNIASRGLSDTVTAVLAPSEAALDYIDGAKTIIVDPPRAGLHEAVIQRLLSEKPKRIIYLSCNPVTQARDVKLLEGVYAIRFHKGYNFFPRTPHIEHLVVLDLM